MKQVYTLLFSLFFINGLTAQNFKFGKVSKEEVLEESHPKEEEANAAVLFREQKTYYELDLKTGYTLVTEVQERIKIYNKAGFDWATKEISLYKNNSDKEKVTNVKGYTYNIKKNKLVDEKLKKNGIFEEEVSEYRSKTKLTMPAVTEGSVIEFRYKIRSPFVTSIDVVPLQYTIPINKLETIIRIPEFLGFKKHFNPRSPIYFQIEESKRPFSLIQTNQVRSGTNVVRHSTQSSKVEYIQNEYSISEKDIPSLKKEVFVDYLQNYAAFLKWELQFTKFPNSVLENYSHTWDGVTKKIFEEKAFSKELTRNNYFNKDIDKLLEGVTDPEAKMALIYEHVKKKVKWNGYAGFRANKGVRKAYKEGEGNVGDINLMLTAMYKYAGLEANPVLVSTQDNGIPLFPTRNGFNYLICNVELPSGAFLLDATETYAAPGELPKRARNWQGRVIRGKENSAWVNLTPLKQSKNHITLNLQFNEEFDIQGKANNSFSGLYAKSFRDKYLDLNEESYLEMLEKDKGNIEISNVETENGGDIGKDIMETFNFKLKNGLEVINDNLYLKPLVFTALTENPFKSDEREYPIFFDFPSIQKNTINIMIPEGYAVESLPESIITKFKEDATFRFVTVQNGNFLRVESVLDLKNIIYTPNDYTILKEFYAQMVEKQTEAIVLKKI